MLAPLKVLESSIRTVNLQSILSISVVSEGSDFFKKKIKACSNFFLPIINLWLVEFQFNKSGYIIINSWNVYTMKTWRISVPIAVLQPTQSYFHVAADLSKE